MFFVLIFALANAFAEARTFGDGEWIRLVFWRPTPRHQTFLLPARANETADQAASRYLSSIQTNRELHSLFGSNIKTIGHAFEWSEEAEGTPILLLANSEADMGPSPFRLNANVRLVRDRHQKPYILPIASQIGLLNDEKILYFRQLLRHFAGLYNLGGADVATQLYGGDPNLSEGVVFSRDLYSQELLQFLIREGTEKGLFFIVGFCRGMQETLVALGGRLIQRVDDPHGPPLHIHPKGSGEGEDPREAFHSIQIVSGTWLSSCLNGASAIIGNSLHRQAADPESLKAVTTRLVPSALAPDGTIEGLSGASIELFQWHPEIRARKGDSIGLTIMNSLAQKMTQVWQFRGSCESRLQPTAP